MEFEAYGGSFIVKHIDEVEFEDFVIREMELSRQGYVSAIIIIIIIVIIVIIAIIVIIVIIIIIIVTSVILIRQKWPKHLCSAHRIDVS